MNFWLWLIIALCFVVYVTILTIKSVRKGSPFLTAIKKWIVNVIDILSGGG